MSYNKNFILDSRESMLKKPTHEVEISIAEYNNLDIAVGVSDARLKDLSTGEPIGRTIIWPQSYYARLDKFESQRIATISEALNARVIAVELPGVGISENTRSSSKQSAELLINGSFNTAAYDMLGALDEVVGFKENEEVELLLYSQGNAIGVSMLDNLGREAHGLKLKVPRVSMIEMVNDSPWNLVKLLKAINSEDLHTDRYLQENEKYDWLTPPSDRIETEKEHLKLLDKRQMINLGMAGVALRRSFMSTLLNAIEKDSANNATGLYHSKFDIMKFDSSNVSRLGSNLAALELIGKHTTKNETGIVIINAPSDQDGHHHPAIHSADNIGVIARDLLK